MNRLPCLAVVLALAGCATVPSGPRVMTMPGPNKSFEQFQADQGVCRQYAQSAIGGTTPSENAQLSAANSAAAGTLIGAAAGAILGSVTGNAGYGAAWGAGTGLLFGSAAGANAAGVSYAESQRRYDIFYAQCMVARGNQLPGRVARAPAAPSYPPPNFPPPNLSGAPRSAPAPGFGMPPGPIAPGPPVPAPSIAPPSSYPPPNTPAPPGLT